MTKTPSSSKRKIGAISINSDTIVSPYTLEDCTERLQRLITPYLRVEILENHSDGLSFMLRWYAHGKILVQAPGTLSRYEGTHTLVHCDIRHLENRALLMSGVLLVLAVAIVAAVIMIEPAYSFFALIGVSVMLVAFRLSPVAQKAMRARQMMRILYDSLSGLTTAQRIRM